MKNLKRYLAVLAIGGALVGTALVAHAKTDTVDDSIAVTSVAVTIDQAVAIATQAVQGSASKAEFENEDGKLMWEVEVVGVDKQVYDFKIDATSGKVLKQELDKADHEDDDENDNEKGDKEDKD